jgi:hypothetical protein
MTAAAGSRHPDSEESSGGGWRGEEEVAGRKKN